MIKNYFFEIMDLSELYADRYVIGQLLTYYISDTIKHREMKITV